MAKALLLVAPGANDLKNTISERRPQRVKRVDPRWHAFIQLSTTFTNIRIASYNGFKANIFALRHIYIKKKQSARSPNSSRARVCDWCDFVCVFICVLGYISQTYTNAYICTHVNVWAYICTWIRASSIAPFARAQHNSMNGIQKAQRQLVQR